MEAPSFHGCVATNASTKSCHVSIEPISSGAISYLVPLHIESRYGSLRCRSFGRIGQRDDIVGNNSAHISAIRPLIPFVGSQSLDQGSLAGCLLWDRPPHSRISEKLRGRQEHNNRQSIPRHFRSYRTSRNHYRESNPPPWFCDSPQVYRSARGNGPASNWPEFPRLVPVLLPTRTPCPPRHRGQRIPIRPRWADASLPSKHRHGRRHKRHGRRDDRPTLQYRSPGQSDDASLRLFQISTSASDRSGGRVHRS